MHGIYSMNFTFTTFIFGCLFFKIICLFHSVVEPVGLRGYATLVFNVCEHPFIRFRCLASQVV